MSGEEHLTVYYDAACPICSAAADSWREGADGQRLEVMPLQDAAGAPGAPSRKELSRVIHAQARGRWLQGARALRAVYRQLGNRPMVLLLSIGIVLGVADPLYALVARYRMHLPGFRRRR